MAVNQDFEPILRGDSDERKSTATQSLSMVDHRLFDLSSVCAFQNGRGPFAFEIASGAIPRWMAERWLQPLTQKFVQVQTNYGLL